LILAPTLWVFFEYIRSFFVSLLWVGDGALVGPHWSISFLGYNIASVKFLAPLASLGGVFVLSMLVVFLNLLFFFLIFPLLAINRRKIIFIFLFLILSLLTFSFYFYSKEEVGEKIDVAVVGTYTER